MSPDPSGVASGSGPDAESVPALGATMRQIRAAKIRDLLPAQGLTITSPTFLFAVPAAFPALPAALSLSQGCGTYLMRMISPILWFSSPSWTTFVPRGCLESCSHRSATSLVWPAGTEGVYETEITLGVDPNASRTLILGMPAT